MELFKENDIVSWAGVQGRVTNKRLNYGGDDYGYILIDFGEFGNHYFLEDGRQARWHKESSLVKISQSSSGE